MLGPGDSLSLLRRLVDATHGIYTAAFDDDAASNVAAAVLRRMIGDANTHHHPWKAKKGAKGPILHANEEDFAVLPGPGDLAGAAEGILRLHRLYELGPSAPTVLMPQGSAEDFDVVGRAAYAQNDYRTACIWLREAAHAWEAQRRDATKLKSIDNQRQFQLVSTAALVSTLDHWSYAAYIGRDYNGALRIARRRQHLKPCQRIIDNINGYEAAIRTEKRLLEHHRAHACDDVNCTFSPRYAHKNDFSPNTTGVQQRRDDMCCKSRNSSTIIDIIETTTTATAAKVSAKILAPTSADEDMDNMDVVEVLLTDEGEHDFASVDSSNLDPFFTTDNKLGHNSKDMSALRRLCRSGHSLPSGHKRDISTVASSGVDKASLASKVLNPSCKIVRNVRYRGVGLTRYQRKRQLLPWHVPSFRVEEVDPRIGLVIFRNFASPEEAQAVQYAGSDALQRASAWDNGAYRAVDFRVSASAWLSHDIISDPSWPGLLRRIENRIAQATGLDLESAEALQVSNYGVGGHYELHYDATERPDSRDLRHQQDGKRLATFMIYLGNVSSGGNTVFPRVGAAITPAAGDAVFWYNLRPDGGVDSNTLHSGCPVLRGAKHVANKWIHERGNNEQSCRRL
eukprot:UC1_evm1s1264